MRAGLEAKQGSSVARNGNAAKASRANAVRHGLTASTILPDLLQRDEVDAIAAMLWVEWKPATPTEEYLIREAARHQAMLRKIEIMESSVHRRGARAALLLNEAVDVSEMLDIALTGAGTSDAIQKLTRYRRSHERAVLRSLDALRQLRDVRASDSRDDGRGESALSESGCENWLAQRKLSRFRCRKCSTPSGIHLVKAKALQCRACRAQTGLRAGTLMAGSKVPLRVWFQAIKAIVEDRGITTRALADVMGIHRDGTVRTIKRRILDASSELLVGLDCEDGWRSLLSQASD